MAINWTVNHKRVAVPVAFKRIATPEDVDRIISTWRAQAKSFGRTLPPLVREALEEWDWGQFVAFGADVFAMVHVHSGQVLCLMAVEYNQPCRVRGRCLLLAGVMKHPILLFTFKRLALPTLGGKVSGIAESHAAYGVWSSRERGTKGQVCAPVVQNPRLRDTLVGIGFEEISVERNAAGEPQSYCLEIGEVGANYLLTAWEGMK